MFIIIVFWPSGGSGWITGVGQLGNSSTASGRSNPGGTVGLIAISLGRGDFFFFHSHITFVYTH